MFLWINYDKSQYVSLIEVDRKLYFIKVYSRQSDNLQSSYLCLDPFLLLPERICPPTWLDQRDFAQFFGFWELLNSRLLTAETNKSLLDLFYWDVGAFQILWHNLYCFLPPQEFVWALYLPQTELNFVQKMKVLWWLFWTYVSQPNLSELCWRSVSWMKHRLFIKQCLKCKLFPLTKV